MSFLTNELHSRQYNMTSKSIILNSKRDAHLYGNKHNHLIHNIILPLFKAIVLRDFHSS